ncbi:MAG: Gfo/Idh/MocA family oxidoreductase [Clostridia bacterium]|nr:Gfo/Idh/MocA family oxidoreductase [Clostridia bacterium]
MKQINIAILGQGRSGRDIHGAHLRKDTERFKVVAVVDGMEERRERAKTEYGCDVYSDYKEILGRKDIDLVVNSMPSNLHFPITKDLLEHDFNVLCEKPFVPTVKECDILTALAAERGRKLLVFQQSRFANYFLKVKEVIASGVLGRIVHIGIQFNSFARRWDWQCCLSNNGGNLANTGPHPLDQALNLLDYYDGMPQVFCHMDRCNTFGDAEDYVKLILKAPDRPIIDLDISSCDAYPCYTYKVEGTRGTLKGTMAHIDWKYFVESEAPEQHLVREPLVYNPGSYPAYCSEKLVWHERSWDGDPQAPFIAAVQTYYDQVYQLFTEGREHDIKLYQVRQQLAVINEAHRQNF